VDDASLAAGTLAARPQCLEALVERQPAKASIRERAGGRAITRQPTSACRPRSLQAYSQLVDSRGEASFRTHAAADLAFREIARLDGINENFAIGS
jgi:hypothetical protein